jgi:hypothetical protein
MKKFLLFLFLNSILYPAISKAQCDLSFPNLVRAFSTDITPLGPDKCQYTVSVQFEVVTNSGFKNLFFHSWLLDDYPSPAIFDCSGNTPATDPGTSAKSFNDLGFIGLNDIVFPADVTVDVTANIATVYPHDNSVVLTQPSNSPGMTATVTRLGNSDTLQFSITNMRVVVNTPCGTPVIVKTDIWGSNSNAPDPKAQCYICGVGQSFGNPQIALQKLCTAAPFQYQVTLTPSGSTPLHVVYRLYADDLDGVREPGTEDSLLFVSDTIVLNPGTPYTSGLINLPGDFCCTDPWAQWGLFVEVSAREFGNILVTPVVEEACAAPDVLPVSLRSFSATRNNSTVLLRWETVTEENSRGFYIERNTGGNWQTMGYVTTKAVNGNSNVLLSYDYTDINNAKGITQYRLREIDLDGKYSYSPIRSVRATGQKGKTIIYPNPSTDGRVNVVFNDINTTRDVSISDLNGRILKTWKGVVNNIQINDLSAGFYTIRIIDTETGEQTVEKIVVKKR